MSFEFARETLTFTLFEVWYCKCSLVLRVSTDNSSESSISNTSIIPWVCVYRDAIECIDSPGVNALNEPLCRLRQSIRAGVFVRTGQISARLCTVMCLLILQLEIKSWATTITRQINSRLKFRFPFDNPMFILFILIALKFLECRFF